MFRSLIAPKTAPPDLPGGIEPARRQFIEQAFGDLLPAPNGSHVPRGKAIEWINDQLFRNRRAIPDIRSELSRQARRTLVLAVTSGKGGVGKTTVSVNLAAAAATQGQRVLLFDADLGMANTHVFAGVNPSRTLIDVVERRAGLGDIVERGPAGVDLICGSSGLARLASLDLPALRDLTRSVVRFAQNYDLLILDTGAGIGSAVTVFLEPAAEVLVVTTPNLAATLDAYGMIKVMHELRLGATVRLLVNQAGTRREATEVFDRLAACARRFLASAPESAGYLRRDLHLEAANQQRTPLVLSEPDSHNARRFQSLATAFIDESTSPPRHDHIT